MSIIFVDEKFPNLSKKGKEEQLLESSDEEDSQVSDYLILLLILLLSFRWDVISVFDL